MTAISDKLARSRLTNHRIGWCDQPSKPKPSRDDINYVHTLINDPGTCDLTNPP